MKKLNASGIAHYVLPLAIVVALVIGVVGYKVATGTDSSKAASVASTAKKKAKNPSGKLNVTVTYNGKPIKNAKVKTITHEYESAEGTVRISPGAGYDHCVDKGKKGLHPTQKPFTCVVGKHEIELVRINNTKMLKKMKPGSQAYYQAKGTAEVKKGQTTNVTIEATLVVLNH